MGSSDSSSLPLAVACSGTWDPGESSSGEIEMLEAAGLRVDGNLFISNRAQVILPYHRMIELAAENAPGRVKIGTTSRGIGPAYEDKMGRRGLRVADLLDLELLKKHIENACREKNMIAHALFNSEPLDAEEMFREYAKASKQIAPFVCDTAALLNQAIAHGQAVGVRRHQPEPPGLGRHHVEETIDEDFVLESHVRARASAAIIRAV